MSWRFRALAMAVTLLYGLLPQIACFTPDQSLTPAEMDCCAKLANDCGQMNMSCCRTVVRTDDAAAAKTVQNPAPPQVDFTAWAAAIARAVPPVITGNHSARNDHAPPDDFRASSIILRI